MPRLIVLLLTLIALALLAVQNLDTPVSLVILSSTLPAISLGILLVSAIGIGALLTLVLYGLVGIRRPPESKYRPMGRRVPFPEGSGSTLPPTEPNYGTSSGSSYTSGSSSAFISEPSSPVDSPRTPQDTPSTSPERFPQDQSPQNSFPEERLPQDRFPESRFPESKSSESRFPESRFSENNEQNSSAQPFAGVKSADFIQQPLAGLKSVFSKKKDREEPTSQQRQEQRRVVGDDWGQIRTTEHKNSWDEEPSKVEEGIQGLFNFGKSVTTSAGQIAEDIASGWNNSPDRSNPTGYVETDDYGSEQYYADDSYYPGNRSDGYDTPPSDNLDQGWERFDDYSDRPPESAPAKRSYGDSLYSDDYGNEDSAYPDAHADPDEDLDEMGPDGVYEADYRVIEPPSKPLDPDR
ncbi:MAG: hypothetical protein AAFY72_03135 [Cyanobacteria bacterium J06649_4]